VQRLKSARLDSLALALTFTDDISTATDNYDVIVLASMAVPWLATYRALLLLSLVVGLFLIYQAAIHRDRPGAKPLFGLITGALLYVSIKLIVSIVRGTPAVFVVTRFNPLGAGLATVGFFLLVIEYTGIENPVSKRTSIGVVLVPAVVSTLAVIDLEYLWVPVGADPSTLSGYAWNLTSVALANQLYMNLLLFAGIGLLVYRGIQSPTVFRVQVGALILSALGPIAGNLAFQFGYVQFNLTPIMFITSGPLIAWAILRAGFLDLIPIGRETVLDQFDASVVTLDKNHRVIDLNERGSQLFDVDDADTVVGDHIDELFADHPTFRERYWTVTAGDSGDESPVEFDGNYYTVGVVSVNPHEGTTLGRSIIIRDITEQKRREQELEELTTRFELALEETDTGVWQWDLETDDVVWDEASERLFGYAPGEFPGTFEGFADRVPDEDLKTVQRKIDIAIETRQEYRADFRVCPPDDDQRWIQARGVIDSNELGEPCRIIGIQTDITEQKEREQALKQAHEGLRQIIDLIPDPLYAKSRDDEVLLSNEANAELHSLTPAEIEGNREREIESDVENIENFDKYRQREVEVIETGNPTVFEEELDDPDGEKHIFKITRIPFEAAGTDKDAVLGYARDVTDIKEYEQELEETKRTLERSNEKLDQFAGMVSHDLRNPLNVIKGRAELLRREAPDEHVEPIERSVERMETMIDDLLTLSRAGESVDDPEPVSLAGGIADSWEAVSSDDIELDVDIPDEAEVEADGDRLRHVFENLFRNAIEHNDPPVKIRVGLLSNETGAVSGFFIADNGSGIPESDREEVFEQGYTTNRDGTGFGLSIVEEIVEAHGWTISVGESDAGGARFDVHTTGKS